MSEDLLPRARAWRDIDPDPATREDLGHLIAAAEAGDAGATAELHDRFDDRLAFGTAGLRGRMAAGPNRMNRVLVAQAAAGLAAALREREAGIPSAVIGYDGRINSEVFARDSAELFAGAGLSTVLLPRPMPTPVLAFAVRELGVSAGVMVTASHNPPDDNGYKVYLGGTDAGSQIVPPVDGAIADHILRVASRGSIADLPRSDDYRVANEDLLDAYVAATARAVRPVDRPKLRVVFSALHGVGWETLARVFAAVGLPEPIVVPTQIAPDGGFPTVAFPNPEEPGAMDLAFETARHHHADLVVVNDPDADRLAIGIPDAAETGGWRRLTGNEVGALLAWEVAERTVAERTIAERLAAEASNGGTAAGSGAGGTAGVFAASVVSSPLPAAIARAYGFATRETLTGFKWVSRVPRLVFGFEEALGYLVDPDVVRDKDGISAAALFVTAAERWGAAGSSVTDRLTALAERFGGAASAQVSVRVAELSRIGELMAGVRATPPTELAGIRITRLTDLAEGSGDLPPSDLLRFDLADGSRVMVRPSGTEPKVKAYLDSFSEVGDGTERRRSATERVEALAAAVRTLLA